MPDYFRYRSVTVILALSLLPVLSAFASYFQDRALEIIVFLGLNCCAFATLLLRKLNEKDKDIIFQALLGFVSVSLLLSDSLISMHLDGWDVNLEYYIFNQVLMAGHWLPQSAIRYNSVLSVSILPTILSEISGIGGVQIFKFVFPVLFCLVPLCLYKLYKQSVGMNGAFLAVFLFVSYAPFYYELIALARQEVAEVIMVAALLAMFSQKIERSRSGTLMIYLLTLGIIVSHYSLAYIYVFFLVIVYLIFRITRTRALLNVSSYVLFTVVIVFLWYASIVSPLEMNTLIKFVYSVSSALWSGFFNWGSRPQLVQAAVGVYSRGGIFQMYRATLIVTNLLIVLGFVSLIFKKRKSSHEKTILPFMAAAMFLLVISVVFPNFAAGLNLSRIYHVSLVFLAPCFVMGLGALGFVARKFLSSSSYASLSHLRLSISTKQLLAAFILFNYFLFNAGLAQAITMDRPTSWILDANRMAASNDPVVKMYYFGYYAPDEDVAAAYWMHSNAAGDVCADSSARYGVLTSYADLGQGLARFPFGCNYDESYVFLSFLNVNYGLVNWYGANYSLSDFSGNLISENRIYSGISTIYASEAN